MPDDDTHGKQPADIPSLDAPRPPRKPMDVAALRKLTDSMRMSPEPAADLVRKMRDEGRY